MKIKYTGLVYGVFGSPLDTEESIEIDLLKSKVKIYHDDKATIIEKGLGQIRFQRKTVKVEVLG